MQRRTGRVAVAATLAMLGAILGACALAEPPAEELVAQATIAGPPGGPCPEEGCGSNSPMIDLIGFHELSLLGIPNLEGFRIETDPARPRVTRIIKNGVPYDLQVVGGIISGRRFGFPPLAGAALVDAFLPIHNVVTGGRYKLMIRSVRSTGYWIGPPGPAFEAYTLDWLAVGRDNPQNVCSNVSGLIERIRQDHDSDSELMGLTVFESVVYEGDRVNAANKTMGKIADDTWINIGCPTHTLAKLRMTHNTVHSQDPALLRPWEQRQATLKLLAADYCGDGTVFTVAGQKLVWQGDQMTYHHAPRTLEARWTHLGAACVGKPRMLFPTTDLGRTTFPKIWDQIIAVCRPAICTNVDTSDYRGAYRMSANP
jgi:ADYC domain